MKCEQGAVAVLKHRDVLWLGAQRHAYYFYQYQGLLPRPEIHNDYDIEMYRQIGRGTYATVHRAMNRTSGQEVAVKIIGCAHSMRSEATRKEYRREIDIMKAVQHDNIMRMLDDYLDEADATLCALSY